ncbi:glycosyltransferase family 4 protein [Chitinibacter bivalviorum]|uniref:Glycosyltransferase family 4 protein n=1 Tax=Chitinibacter bivalviorum TaxID=2739434 RepID=A0A7H9BFJ3_9NEIS|nr:glycosyltransferase family 4 protein [Chitinibacter bivalviorum]QLG87006.1 glycosyltransferase family 4 protein [Chitinibacter bivalviorum]
MKILLVSQYFYPESFIINDIVRTLVFQGHSVSVATGKPNYPDGNIYPGYSEKKFTKDWFFSCVPVYRAPLRPRMNSGAKNLFLNYFSFVINGIRFFPNAVKNENFDVVLVFAMSPITAALPAIYLKWKFGKHLAVWIQDLWPESLSATGFVKNKWALRLVGCMVRAIYAFTDTLLVQSRAFYEPVARYAKPSKIIYYPNSYLELPINETPSTLIPAELLSVLNGGFCLVFAGNLGTAQSLETLVQVSERLKYLSEFRLILVGSGSMLSWIEEQKVLKKLDNLVLAGRFPSSEMPQIFSRAAGLLVTLKREEIFAYTIPSKVQAYLAAGRPVIAALDGEGARVIEEANAGLTCPAEDVDGLVRCIETLFQMSPLEREKLGQSGRNYFLKHFEMGRQCQRLVEILESQINKKGSEK